MKNITIKILIIGIITLNSCENKKKEQDYTYPSSNYQPIYDNSSYNSSNGTSPYPVFNNNNNQYDNSKQEHNYTIQDIWDEAEYLRSEAESVLSDAEDIGCDDAVSAANNAISNSYDCMDTNNYSDAEYYLEYAQSELSNAKSYLEDCQYNQGNDNEDE